MVEKDLKALIETNAEGRVRKHESTVVEYKANFNYNSVAKYAKTLAAFANNRGGTIVFGVTNNPRIAKGMTNENRDRLDPAQLSGELNSMFAPEIDFELDDLVTNDGRRFAFITAHESRAKPVIAQANRADIVKDGDIYYRYNGQSSPIKHPELFEIVNSIRKREQDLWMSHFRRIAKIGVDKAAVFDPDDGLVKGPRGSFLISKELLPKLSFIKDGKVVEKEGSPAITIFGNAEIVSGDSGAGLVGIAERAISENDIFVNFLNKVSVQSPMEYLKACLSSSTKYMPMYYYMRLSGMTVDELSNFIDTTHGLRKFQERLSTDGDNLKYELTVIDSKAYRDKKRILDDIRANSLEINEDRAWLRRLFNVLRSLDDPEVVRKHLLAVYKLPLRKLDVISEFRKAACLLDYIENYESS